MFLPEISSQIVVDVSLESLDAEMSACAFLWRSKGPSINRQIITPQRLIGYRVFSDYETNLLGECGWINLQYLDSNRASLWFQVSAPTGDDYDRYARYYQFSLPGNVYEWSADELREYRMRQLSEFLSFNRSRMLGEICDFVVQRLPKPNLVVDSSTQPEDKPSRFKGGRPSLPDDEKLRRLALVILEKQLKKLDPGLTRGEFVVQIQEKLRLPVEMHTIKNSAKLLVSTQQNGERDLLTLAEKQAAEWQKHFT